MLKPLRRRGTEDQRIRRIKKWGRRQQIGMIRRHFPCAWRYFVKGAELDALWIISGVLTPEEVLMSRFAGTGDWIHP